MIRDMSYVDVELHGCVHPGQLRQLGLVARHLPVQGDHGVIVTRRERSREAGSRCARATLDGDLVGLDRGEPRSPPQPLDVTVDGGLGRANGSVTEVVVQHREARSWKASAARS